MAQKSVDYVGHVLCEEGLKPGVSKVRAISEMPVPQNREELGRFLGMVTYVSKFLPNLSQMNAPLRLLMKAEIQWHWDKEQKRSFESLKKAIMEAPVLTFYDVTKPVCLSVDASSKGIGTVLLQEGRPVTCASKALTAAQQNYAQIEKEMAAIVFGCNRFHKLLFGREVEVETDHKPLEMIFKKPLHATPMRLQKMRLQVQSYSLTVKWKPGDQLYMADALSRAYLHETEVSVHNIAMVLSNSYEPGTEEPETKVQVDVLSKCRVTEEYLERFKQETENDKTLQVLSQVVLKGWPEKRKQCQKEILQCWNVRDELTVYDGVLFKGEKLVVPVSLRAEMKKKVHSAHLGIEYVKVDKSWYLPK